VDKRITLKAASFGAVGDGVADDGPAIGRMVAAASGRSGVTLRFEPKRTYYIGPAAARYAFDLTGATDLAVDGRGSTFELAPHVRFLRLRGSRQFAMRRLSVDFRPLPFADGEVIGADASGRWVDVRIADGSAKRVCGEPTLQDGEQAWFGMLWADGPYGTISRHYWLRRVEPGRSPDVVRAYASDDPVEFGDIVPGKWRISLPAPGIAHRYGPGACLHIRDNETVTMEDVEVWSAPWIAFEVARNTGKITFRRAHVRPKPGSGRLMSTCRDGFHVKGNRAALLWDGCVMSGMTDDAMNISTHTSVVSRVIAPDRIEVRQKFPLLHMPWRIGSELVAADEAAKRLLGSARVTRVETGPEPPPTQGEPAAPISVLTLDRSLQALQPGTMVWDARSSNPNTTIRDCRIEMSCRLQSPVTLERCDVTALLWFYAEPIEGPFPGPVTVRRCTLRRGRGNPVHAVVCSGRSGSKEADGSLPPRAIHDLTFEDNEIWGGFAIEGAEGVRAVGNRFMEGGAPVRIEGNHRATISGNRDRAGRPAP